MNTTRFSHFPTVTAFGAVLFLSACAGSGAQHSLLPKSPDAALTMGTSRAYSVIYPFGGGLDGADPATQLVFDSRGNAYGTTVQGGNAGCGTVFRLHENAGVWHETVLHNFSCHADGKNPYGGVILDAAGNLYGATVSGGLNGGCTGDGCGVIFKIAKTGGESVLYTFKGQADGGGPGSALAMDTAGNLYGTAPDDGKYALGTVFELQPMGGSWHFAAIHQFTGGDDGSTGSLGALLIGAHGALYGVTELGGANQDGIAYRMNHISGTSWKFTPVYAFKGEPDGANPYGGLIENNGKFYGTTYFGGAGGSGSVFELTPKTGRYGERILYSFKGGNDGSLPTSTLLAGTGGALYGTTSSGGNTGCDCGTVFSLAGGSFTETVLHRFGAVIHDGQSPYYALTQSGGLLYSSTVAGGTSGSGTIFSITP